MKVVGRGIEVFGGKYQRGKRQNSGEGCQARANGIHSEADAQSDSMTGKPVAEPIHNELFRRSMHQISVYRQGCQGGGDRNCL